MASSNWASRVECANNTLYPTTPSVRTPVTISPMAGPMTLDRTLTGGRSPRRSRSSSLQRSSRSLATVDPPGVSDSVRNQAEHVGALQFVSAAEEAQLDQEGAAE